MAVRLSLRPDLDQNLDGLPLYISGALPEITPRLAYEGRLQVHNAIGRCSVQIIDGSDPLPPGSTVYIDHATQQIVVAWPPYSQYVTPLENPGFETGDTSGWTFVPRGGSRTPVVDTAYRYEGLRSLKWPGGRGMGSEGGIEVEAWNNTIGPCLPGQRVTTHIRGMYNPAGHHFGSQYRALVRFVDGAGNPIGAPARGQVIKGRGQNGRWNDASVSASGPAGTAGVQLGGWLTGSDAPTWMDTASWDVPSEIGVDEVGEYDLVIRVRDSAGRTAIWTGTLVKYVPVGTVVSLLHMDGPDGSFVITDATGRSWFTGLVRISTAQSKFGGASAALLVDGDNIYAYHHPDFNFGAGDFTIECWVRPGRSYSSGSYGVVVAHDDIAISANRGWLFLFDGDAGGRLGFSCKVGTTSFNVYNPASITTNEWHHIVATREGSVLRLYVDGVQVASSAITGSLNITGNIVQIGIAANGINALGPGYRGYIDELRIVKNGCRYPGGTAFVPPIAPFPSE